MADAQTLEQWMRGTEGENLEFKAARNRYDFEELTQYCVALANEGGGRIILGVTDARPRQVVGSNAFNQPERTRAGLNQRLHLGITFEEIQHPNGRVLIFHVPSRPVGIAIQWEGRYLIRDNDSLVGMPGERLRDIIAESGHDFSADVCEGLSIDDLEDAAVEEFRRRWINKSGNSGLAALSKEQLLSDIEATVDGQVTYAGLILFGSRRAMRKHVAQAEVVFEYRSSNAPGPAAQREEFTEAFFLWYDLLWELINLRNDLQHYQDGMFVLDVPTFSERAVREAILNAVSHRNYQLGSNVWVRQYPDRIEIDSPGGFPAEITPGNILYRQSPRNRRIAEIFGKCGLVERAGQGMDLMFESAIRDSKSCPDFRGTDQYTVCLKLNGRVRNKEFVRYLRQFDATVLESLSTDDWLVLDMLCREEPLPAKLLDRTDQLLEDGFILRAVRGRFILGKSYYQFRGQESQFQRLRDREEKKERLEARLLNRVVDGCAMGELQSVLPQMSRHEVRTLLEDLRAENRAHIVGETRNARWYVGPPSEEDPG
ncbi:MAG: ATP-binding protein [Candidatus Paceibacterota bacterium]